MKASLGEERKDKWVTKWVSKQVVHGVMKVLQSDQSLNIDLKCQTAIAKLE